MEWKKAVLKWENVLFLKLKYFAQDCKQHFLPTMLSRFGNHNPCWKGVKKDFSKSRDLYYFQVSCWADSQNQKCYLHSTWKKKLKKPFDKNRQQKIFVLIYYRNMLKVQKASNKLQRYSNKLDQHKQQRKRVVFKVTDISHTPIRIMK